MEDKPENNEKIEPIEALDVAQQIETDLQLDSQFSHSFSQLLTAEASYHLLRERVAEAISYMLDTNFGQLLNLLYLMDVDEEKIKAMLVLQSDEEPKYVIADAVIERSLRRVKTKREYKVKRDENDPESW